MRNKDQGFDIESIQIKIKAICEYLKEHRYPVEEIYAHELIAYFEGDAPSGDSITLEMVLESRWLLIHEIIEINELKKHKLLISSELLVTKPLLVFHAHLIATEWEFSLALHEGSNKWVKRRLNDVRTWLEDPSLPLDLSAKYQELLQKYD
ncbi:MAG: hypothetical protein EAX90_15075 [Candidatus Heimdallarchaeota archaeon]|nr:hypothetical protein [Candidatus Heimdallarchaeota archaeon]